MRFSWIALPVLLATLAGAATSTDGPPMVDETPNRETELEYAPSSSNVPLAAMPAGSGETQKVRHGSKGIPRHDPLLGDHADPPEYRPANRTRVRIRTADRARLAFLPEVNRATTGYLSSCTTACPPPSS